MISLL